MAHITFNYSKLLDKFVAPHEVDFLQAQVTAADEMIRKGTGPGADFLGWRDLPENYDREEFDRILKAAEKIKEDSDVLVVIGIGGSYLGAKAAIDFLNHHFANLQTKEERKAPQIVYAGNSISSTYLADLLEYVEDKDFSVNVISKSGTTTEPAIAFRLFKELLIKKYGQEEANKRIYATTDRQKGAVKVEADANGWDTFVVPDDIGGRFSVLQLQVLTSKLLWKVLTLPVKNILQINFLKMKLTNMQLYVISFTVKATQQRSWLTMNHHFNTSQNGGNNWLENLKVKTKEVSSQLQQTSQQTCTLLVNSFKKVHVTSLKLLFV